MAKSLRQRFERLVDTTGEHHLWIGAKRPDSGTGRFFVNGKDAPAHQIAWELEYGTIKQGARILPCAEVPACVRLEHLREVGSRGDLPKPVVTKIRPTGRKGSGYMRELKPGLWELTVSAGKYDDGTRRREYRRVQVPDRRQAARHLAALIAEIDAQAPVVPRETRDLSFDEAVERFLTEHLAAEKGREPKTVEDYRRLHMKWFSPHLGRRHTRDVDETAIDEAFGRMRRAGLSKSRLNQARSLYAPFFKWAKNRRFVLRNPMLEFDLPTSMQATRERTPPEVEQLSMLLNEAVTIIPDVAPLLALGAVTGMRRGELVGVKRANIVWRESRLKVDSAIDAGRRVKTTKTRKERSFYVDAATLDMLHLYCDEMDERARIIGVAILPDAYLFSLEADCSKPIPPDFVTKRVAILKDHLGVADKRSETIALEDEALELYRQPPHPRPAGKTGPSPKGGMSYREIGKRLDRSERWAALAVAAALRREQAAERARSASLRTFRPLPSRAPARPVP